MITRDAKNLRDSIVNNKPGTISYAAENPSEILAEDKLISTYPISVKPESVAITPAGKVFE